MTGEFVEIVPNVVEPSLGTFLDFVLKQQYFSQLIPLTLYEFTTSLPLPGPYDRTLYVA